MAFEAAGIEYETQWHTLESLKAPEFLAINPNGKSPVLETPEGAIFETAAILRHAARVSGNLYGASAFENSVVDQWLDWGNTELAPLAPLFLYQLFGFEFPGLTYEKQTLFRSKAEFIKRLQVLNKHLAGKTHIVGDSLTIADIFFGNLLVQFFTFALGDKERKGLANVGAFLEALAKNDFFTKWFGRLRLVPSAFNWHKFDAAPAAKPKAKKEKKAAKPAAKPQPKKEKPKGPVFPPTDVNLNELKFDFINNKDIPAALEKFWSVYDPKGWSLYHLKYIKYNDQECREVYKTNNLLRGFLSRSDYLSKYIFGTHGIFGEEPELTIEGVWMIRGTELPEIVTKDHPQYDVYEWHKLDHTNAEHKALVNEFWALRGEDGDKIGDRPLQTFKWIR